MDLNRDQKGGAAVVKFEDLTTEELRTRALTFPEARAEYVKRKIKERA